MVRALAIVCFRNEAVHIRRCLSDLINSGLDVVAIDNASTDDSRAIASEFLGKGLLRIDTLAWAGSFSLTDQLRAKGNVIASSDHDWIVHADADEWLCSSAAGQSLIEGINEADAAGFTAINFHELVFVPLPNEDYCAPDYAQKMTTYYFFQPGYPRLNRAWKRTANLDSFASGGHNLSGPGFKLFENDFMLRHYIVLSEEHARAKYVGRTFSDEDRSRGWHGNRVLITAENLRVTSRPWLKKLPHPSSQDFDLSEPTTMHFWQWEQAPKSHP